MGCRQDAMPFRHRSAVSDHLIRRLLVTLILANRDPMPLFQSLIPVMVVTLTFLRPCVILLRIVEICTDFVRVRMLQTSGLWLALATFLSIWWGHVGVRWLEARWADLRPPMIVLIVAGVALNGIALWSQNVTIGGVCSVIGFSLWWDAFELVRQDKRVRHGHAPANPRNPRHARYLAEGRATTHDPLDREPSDPMQVMSAPIREQDIEIARSR